MKRLLLSFLLGVSVLAQVSVPDTVIVRDEGTTQGRVTTANVTGGSVSASVSGNIGTINITGGGSVTVKTATLTWTSQTVNLTDLWWQPVVTMRAQSNQLGLGSGAIGWSPDLGMLTTGEGYSTDGGNTWTASTTPAFNQTDEASDLYWAPDQQLFVITADFLEVSARAGTSPDGDVWTDGDVSEAVFAGGIGSNSSVIVHTRQQASNDADYATTVDGVDWTAINSGIVSNFAPIDIIWESGLGLWVMVGFDSTNGNPIYTSSSATAAAGTWTQRTDPVSPSTSHTWKAIAWSPDLGMFAVVSRTASVGPLCVITSTDGVTWTERQAPPGLWLDIQWSAALDLFVASNTTGGIMTSPDGIRWSLAKTGFNQMLNVDSIACADSLSKCFMAVNGNGAGGNYHIALKGPTPYTFTTHDTTMRRFTITDGDVTSASKIVGTIRRPNVTESDDRGWVFGVNVVRVQNGSFDVIVWLPEDSIANAPTSTIELQYIIG